MSIIGPNLAHSAGHRTAKDTSRHISLHILTGYLGGWSKHIIFLPFSFLRRLPLSLLTLRYLSSLRLEYLMKTVAFQTRPYHQPTHKPLTATKTDSKLGRCAKRKTNKRNTWRIMEEKKRGCKCK